MTRDEQTRWSLRLAETGGAIIGAVVAALVTVVLVLAGAPLIRAAIVGIGTVVLWGVIVLVVWRRARPKHLERDARVPCGHLKRQEQETNP